MADTTYRVRVDYQADVGSASLANMSRLVSLLDHAANLGMRVMRTFKEVGGYVVGLKSTIEMSTVGIASMLHMMHAPGLGAGPIGFRNAMAESSQLMTKMLADSAKLPGTFEDLTGIFQSVLQPGLASGASALGIESLSQRLMGFAAISQIAPQVAGQEAFEILAGRARMQAPLWLRLSSIVHMTTEEFNKLSQAQRFATVQKALFSPEAAEMMKALSHTWVSVSSTLRNNVETFIRAAGDQAFKDLEATVGNVNEYFQSNAAMLNEMGRTVGDKLVAGFEAIKNAVSFIAAHKDALLKIGEAFAVYKAGSLFGGGIGTGHTGGIPGAFTSMGGNLGQFFDIFRKHGALSGGLAPWKQLMAAQKEAMVKAAPTMGQVVGGAMQGYFVNKLTGVTDPFNQAIDVVTGTLGSLGGPIGDVAKLFEGLHAGLEYFTTWLDHWHMNHISQHEQGLEAMKLYRQFEAIGSPQVLPDHMAKDAIRYFQTAGIMNAMGGMSNDAFWNFAKNKMDLDQAGANELFKLAINTADWIAWHPSFFKDADGKGGKTVVANKGPTYNTITVNQRIENANDPDRVLFKTREALEDILRHPIESPHNLVATIR